MPFSDICVIFITENDVIGDGRLIYHIDRTIAESGRPFADGSHIICVNAARKDNSELGRLVHDLSCTEPAEMNYSELRERTSYFKENDKGVKQMCEIWEEIKAEGRAEGREQATGNAIRMLRRGNLSVEEINELAKLIAG